MHSASGGGCATKLIELKLAVLLLTNALSFFTWSYVLLNLSNRMCAALLQLCPTLCNPMHYSPPGSSVHGILQARILGWVAIETVRSTKEASHEAAFLECSCTTSLVIDLRHVQNY